MAGNTVFTVVEVMAIEIGTWTAYNGQRPTDTVHARLQILYCGIVLANPMAHTCPSTGIPPTFPVRENQQ